MSVAIAKFFYIVYIIIVDYFMAFVMTWLCNLVT